MNAIATVPLFYRVYGSGAPLLILHGLFGTADNWNTLAKYYGESFTTYVLDQRNHGQSPHHEVFNYEAMVADLKAFMDVQQLDKAHIMGHSMGGKVAMLFATQYPQHVDRLIISDIGPKYYPPHHQTIIQALQTMPLASISSRKQAEELMAERIEDLGTRQFLLKNLYWKDEQMAWRFNLQAIVSQIEEVGKALPEYAQFDGTTLFVRGANSRYILDDDINLITNHFPLAQLVTIPNAGHWVHAEQPVAYFEATKVFLLG